MHWENLSQHCNDKDPVYPYNSFSLGLVDGLLTSLSACVVSSGTSSLVIDSLTWIGFEVGDFPFFFFLYLLASSELALF